MGWHVDVTRGKCENFSLPGARTKPRQAPSQFSDTLRGVRARGLVQIVNTPWFFGASPNIGPGPDEYRLFVGMRAEFAQIFSGQTAGPESGQPASQRLDQWRVVRRPEWLYNQCRRHINPESLMGPSLRVD